MADSPQKSTSVAFIHSSLDKMVTEMLKTLPPKATDINVLVYTSAGWDAVQNATINGLPLVFRKTTYKGLYDNGICLKYSENS